MIRTKILIVGTTALACGLAGRLGADCTVIDRGWSAGGEFADAMVAELVDLTGNRLPLTEALIDELWERGALNRTGNVHIPAFAGAFAKRFRASGCRLLLGTRVTGTERREDGFHVTVFLPREGYSEIVAEQIVNTEPQAFMEYWKTFSLMLTDGEPEPMAGASPCVRRGRFADEFLLTFDVSWDCTVPGAQKLADAWLGENRSCLRSAVVAGTALAFGYRFDAVTDTVRDGIRYVPSASYPDAVSAFEGGEGLCL